MEERNTKRICSHHFDVEHVCGVYFSACAHQSYDFRHHAKRVVTSEALVLCNFIHKQKKSSIKTCFTDNYQPHIIFLCTGRITSPQRTKYL